MSKEGDRLIRFQRACKRQRRDAKAIPFQGKKKVWEDESKKRFPNPEKQLTGHTQLALSICTPPDVQTTETNEKG